MSLIENYKTRTQNTSNYRRAIIVRKSTIVAKSRRQFIIEAKTHLRRMIIVARFSILEQTLSSRQSILSFQKSTSTRFSRVLRNLIIFISRN